MSTSSSSRLNLHLSPDMVAALDQLVELLPAVDNKSAAVRLAIDETRDKYDMLAKYLRNKDDEPAVCSAILVRPAK